MKRIFLMLMAATVMLFSVSKGVCEAKDIWVERWAQAKVEVYVMAEPSFLERSKERQTEKYYQMEICKGRTGNVAL